MQVMVECLVLPAGKLNESATFIGRYLDRDNFSKLGEGLSQIFITDIRIEASDKYL